MVMKPELYDSDFPPRTIPPPLPGSGAGTAIHWRRPVTGCGQACPLPHWTIVLALPVLVMPFLVLAVLVMTAGLPGWISGGVFTIGGSIAQAAHQQSRALSSPDAVIVTKSLSHLPKDILAIPILKDLLTQDFAFYYRQQNENFLSFSGTVRRIAFEHELNISDYLLTYLFNTPAILALWKGNSGRLDEFILSVERTPLRKLLEYLARIALDDKKLTELETRATADGEGAAVYRIAFGSRRHVYLSAVGERFYLFSDPAMDLPGAPAKGTPAALPGRVGSLDQGLTALFAESGNSQNNAGFLALHDPKSAKGKHLIVVSMRYLSMGYQRFFPNYKALRFEFNFGNWSNMLLVTNDSKATSRNTEPLWDVVPKSPALCISAPLDAEALRTTLGAALPSLRARIDAAREKIVSPLAVCWYSDSTVATPLFVLRTLLSSEDDPFLLDALTAVVGAYEAGRGPPRQVEEEKMKGRSLFGKAKDLVSRFNIFSKKKKEKIPVRIWSRIVSSPYGIHAVAESGGLKRDLEKSLWYPRYFKVKLARFQDYLLFSPDDRLVDLALSVLARKYPSAGESLGQSARKAILLASPPTLGRMARETMRKLLPESREALMIMAVNRHLVPSLYKLNQYPAYAGVIDNPAPGKAGWQSLKWVKLPKF